MASNRFKFFKEKPIDAHSSLSRNPNEHAFVLKTDEQTIVLIVDWTKSRSAHRLNIDTLDMNSFIEIHPEQYPISYHAAVHFLIPNTNIVNF